MRGTELTPEQIGSAREFIQGRIRVGSMPEDETVVVSMEAGNLCRLLAWYGALRYQAGASGIGGTEQKPGPIVVKP